MEKHIWKIVGSVIGILLIAIGSLNLLLFNTIRDDVKALESRIDQAIIAGVFDPVVDDMVDRYDSLTEKEKLQLDEIIEKSK